MNQKIHFQKRKILQQYIRDARKQPPLDARAERLLIEKIKRGSKRAMDKLISANLLFVIKIAYRYHTPGMDLEDTVSAGNLGLIEAARRMDPSRQNKFITYAVWWIRQSIRHSIFNEARLVRLASNKEEKIRQLLKLQLPVKNYIGGTGLDWEKLAKTSKAKLKDLLPLIQFIDNPLSFDSPMGDEDNGKLSDTLPSNTESPVDEIETKEISNHLYDVAACLDDREYSILHQYFGLKNTKSLSMGQIGNSVNLSKERVRQIKEDALKKLRHALRDKFSYEHAH